MLSLRIEHGVNYMVEINEFLRKTTIDLQALSDAIKKEPTGGKIDNLSSLISRLQNDSKHINKLIRKEKLTIDETLRNDLIKAIDNIKKSGPFIQSIGPMQQAFVQMLLTLANNIKKIPNRVERKDLDALL